MEELKTIKKKRWRKVLLWCFLTPFIFFFVAMALLYVPPIQNFIRKQATEIISESTGMDIEVGRIDLRFPLSLLVRDVCVVQQSDTLLQLEQLKVKVQAWPLFSGKVEVDEVSIEDADVYSSTLIDGFSINGHLGHFNLQSHGVDLLKESVILNGINLSDTHFDLQLADTVPAEKDSIETSLAWNIQLHQLSLSNVSVNVNFPLDTLQLQTKIGTFTLQEAFADLKDEAYGWQRADLAASSFVMNSGTANPIAGFDPNHMAIRDVSLNIDSVLYAGRHLSADIRHCSMNERSGLSLLNWTGSLRADSSVIQIPNFEIKTPHSEIKMNLHTFWSIFEKESKSDFTARLLAHIGKQDMMLLAASLPVSFKEAYPSHPLVIKAGTQGNLRKMYLSRFSMELPGAFSLNGSGSLNHVADSIRRNGKFHFDMETHHMNFMTALSGLAPNSSFVLPDSMKLVADMALKGPQYKASIQLNESQGRVDWTADYAADTESYQTKLAIDSLQLHHFLPKDSLYLLSTQLEAHGRGLDWKSPRTSAHLSFLLKHFHYGKWKFNQVDLQAGLHQSLATVSLQSKNELLKMQAKASALLNRKHMEGKADLNVDQVDLYQLGIADKPLRQPFAFHFTSTAQKDSVNMQLKAGDMHLAVSASNSLDEVLNKIEKLSERLLQQIDNRQLNHKVLRSLMPSVNLSLQAGRENPLNSYLATQNMEFKDMKMNWKMNPETGINGESFVYALSRDSMILDTLYITTRQDSAGLHVQTGVANAPSNKQVTFHSSLSGIFRNEDAELMFKVVDDKGIPSVHMGIQARPLTEGHGKGNGLLFQLTPRNPIIAYKKFSFVDKANWGYLHKNKRAYANIDMESEDGLSFRLLSNREDTLSLQNMSLEFSRFQLNLLSKALPYVPALDGLLSIEAQVQQTDSSFQVASDLNIQDFVYERQPVGTLDLASAWLPAEDSIHYLNAMLMYDNREILLIDGKLKDESNDSFLDLYANLEGFPLKMFNAFIPNQMLVMTGALNGDVSMKGNMNKPKLEGTLAMDSVSMFAPQVGAKYWLDNRPLRMRDNQLLFDKYAIYTTSTNPFIVDGKIDLRDLSNPRASLDLKATDYTLLDAPRTKESLVYGKIFVDLIARLQGPLNALKMRGTMNLLGNTDVTYVLTESPLTVEDRLNGLVTFTSFADTLHNQKEETPTMSLGGMDMNMSVNIDNSVRVRADLSSDRSKYVELEGGGNLNMQYTPQGDLNLSGRYTLTGGTMKYSLPIIPLKEFALRGGSYVDWKGNVMNPNLNLTATERVRASVSDGDGGSRMVNFDVSIIIRHKLENPELIFDISAPEDATVQNELQAMGATERSKQAIAMLATGIYLNSGVKGGGLNMGTALNSVLQSQINALAGSALQSSNANLSLGVENRTMAETGDTQTDYSFRYSQRFFNDRVQIVIGGKVSSGNNATNSVESFIDNISVEYRLDKSSTRYVRVFHNKNYESVLDGEITETGVGVVLRRKMDHLGELFIFKKKKP